MSLNKRSDEYGVTKQSEFLNAISDTVVDTLTVPQGASACLVSVIGGEPIKWRSDGIDPTASVGHPLAPGGHLELFMDDMTRFRTVCGTASQTTDLFVTYYGER